MEFGGNDERVLFDWIGGFPVEYENDVWHLMRDCIRTIWTLLAIQKVTRNIHS